MDSSFSFPTLAAERDLDQNPLMARATVSAASDRQGDHPAQPLSQGNDKSLCKAHQMQPPKKKSGKVMLEKGYSQLDWLRLQKSEKNLAGLKGHRLRRDITIEEVARHNSTDDAWTVLRGKVYNITPYMRFHPGGVPQLKRGAGIDSTSLFNKYHAWVNADMMLESCLIGLLVRGEAASNNI